MIHENGTTTITGETINSIEHILFEQRANAAFNSPEDGVASTLLALFNKVARSTFAFTVDELVLLLITRAMQGWCVFSDEDTYLDDQDGKARYEAAYEAFLVLCIGYVPQVPLQLVFDNLHFLTVKSEHSEHRVSYRQHMNTYLCLVAKPKKQRDGVVRLSPNLELHHVNSLRDMAISNVLTVANGTLPDAQQHLEAAFDALRAALGNIRLTGVRIDERHDIF